MTGKEKGHIEVFRLGGRWYARPKGQLGTCGFYPYPWTVCAHRSRHEAMKDFYSTHMGKIKQHLSED